MIVPSIAPTWTKAARGANSSVAPHAASVVRPSTSAPSDELVPHDAAEHVVDDPRDAEQDDADRDRPARAERPARPDEVRRRVEVVEEDQQREAGQPRRVGLPLEPVQDVGQPRRGGHELLDAVEAAAVDLPRLVLAQVVVERDEVERRPDPDDPGHHVQPAREEREPLVRVRVHYGRLPAVTRDRDQLAQRRLELLLAGPLEPAAQHLEDLRLRAAVDEDHEAEAELLLVDLVQVRQLGEDHRVGVGALLGGRARRQAAARADRRVRVQRLELLRLVELGDRVVGGSERVLARRQQLDQPRPSLEELRELLGAQLPR